MRSDDWMGRIKLERSEVLVYSVKELERERETENYIHTRVCVCKKIKKETSWD